MRTWSIRLVLLGLVASAGTLFLSACSSGESEGTIRIYTGRHYDLEQAFEAFAEEHNVEIEYLEGSDAELRERIAAEGRTPRPTST